MSAIVDSSRDTASVADAARGSPSPQAKRVPGAAFDPIFKALLYICSGLILVLLLSIVILLFWGGWPALSHFGPSFYWSTVWNPVTEKFGAGVMIYGTLFTGFLSLLIALPMSFGIAFFLTEIAPLSIRKPVGMAIQLLAAVPSIIFGMWGVAAIIPLMANYIQPFLKLVFGHVPVVSYLFAGATSGFGMLTAAVILAFMVIPFITAMFVEILEAVPPMLKESAYGVGCTTFEVFRNVSVPYGRTALVGATMLGFGRALGETMAVTYVIGNANRISASLFSSGATIASTIANEFPDAPAGSLRNQSLMELGFVLFVISFIVLAISRMLIKSGVK
ncbi:phosphate transport system permease protein [Labrys miyagiensis]|uniref:Phosphate transport system permease protein n=1 Tax=Labrys miyagiensis TaxID=346912 RepID=A0ABQ6CTN5_9HYPH|nr:phosphate ABC transporter permease subunit PstC [Labrys miyagiensis]GLS22345.1 phosphate transport system permease protein [Labrys miyagiensis]